MWQPVTKLAADYFFFKENKNLFCSMLRRVITASFHLKKGTNTNDYLALTAVISKREIRNPQVCYSGNP